MSAPVIEEFVAVERNTLHGFCRVRMPSGTIYHDVSVHRSSDKAWASPPGKPMLDRAGQHIKDAAGKPMWSPVVTFASKELRDRFSTAVLEALRLSHPAVFS